MKKLAWNLKHDKNEDHGTWPITSWQTEGGKVEAVTDFIFLGSKITVDSDCSHEIKRHLFLGRKSITNLDRILKSRTITLLTRVRIVKAMVFPVVMYGCESWTIKKAEHWRIDAFWIVVLEKIFESPLNSKEIKPVNPKGNPPWTCIGRTDAEAEAPVTWTTWCEELTPWKRPWCWERLKAKGEWGGRRWDG